MESHAAIIRRLGGIRRLAQALGHPNHTTVQGWHERDRIPVERWMEVVEIAHEIGEPLTPAELMPEDLRRAS